MEGLTDITASKLRSLIIQHSPERHTQASLQSLPLMYSKIATFPEEVVAAIKADTAAAVRAGEGRYATYGTRRRAGEDCLRPRK